MTIATRQRPTRRQLEVLRTYIRAGSIAAAAHELEIAETTARQHLSALYRRTGCVNAAQAAYLLGAGDGPHAAAARGKRLVQNAVPKVGGVHSNVMRTSHPETGNRREGAHPCLP